MFLLRATVLVSLVAALLLSPALAEDPKPDPASFSTFDNYLAYVENNNNVAWRNFDVIAGPPSAGSPPAGRGFP